MTTASKFKTLAIVLMFCAFAILAPPFVAAVFAAERTISDAASCGQAFPGAVWNQAERSCRTTRDDVIRVGDKVIVDTGVTLKIDHTIWNDGELANRGTIKITYLLDNYHLMSNEGTIEVLSGWLGNHEGQLGPGVLTNTPTGRIVAYSGAQVSNQVKDIFSTVQPWFQNDGRLEIRSGAKFWNMDGVFANKGVLDMFGYMKTVAPGQTSNDAGARFTIGSQAMLDIYSPDYSAISILDNKGVLDNYGIIDASSGVLQDMKGAEIHNKGLFVNRLGAVVSTEGSELHNSGTFDNFGAVDVSDGHWGLESMDGEMSNSGEIYNNGEFYIGDGDFTNDPKAKIFRDCQGTFKDGSIQGTPVINICGIDPVAKIQTQVTARNTPIVLKPRDLANREVPYDVQFVVWVGTVNQRNSPATWTPPAGFLGSAKIYLRTRWHNTNRDVELTVNVTNLNNTPPVVTPRVLSIPVNAAVLMNLAASDANNDPLTYGVSVPPAHGQVTGTWPANVIYKPVAGFSGTDTFKYFANDGFASSVAQVTISVAGNVPPVTLKLGSFFQTFDTFRWFKSPLAATWTGSAPLNGLASCDAGYVQYSGPDSPSVTLTAHCTDRAGNVGTGTYTFGYDTVAPAVTVSKPPSASGWYNSASVTMTAVGTDAMSGISSCTSSTVSAEGPNQQRSMICVDRAGNLTSVTGSVNIDRTAPTVSGTPSRPYDTPLARYLTPVTITWNGSDGYSGVESCDAPLTYSGPVALPAILTGTCRDKAGNVGTGTYALMYEGATSPLLLASSPESSILGQPVTLTATATATPIVSGRVTFYAGATVLGTTRLSATTGIATLTTTLLQPGKNVLNAYYIADAGFVSAPLNVVVHMVTGVPQLGHQLANSYDTVNNPASLTVNDFNNDGKGDLAVLNFYTGSNGNVSILLGDGTGAFVPAAVVTLDSLRELRAIAGADVDGDGNVDVMIANINYAPADPGLGHNVSVLRGNGDGTFQPAVDYAVGGQTPLDVVAGDVDDDGKVDLITSNYHSHDLSVLIGNGDGSFRPAQHHNVGLLPTSLVLADFNEDGNDDVVVTHGDAMDLGVLLGTGDGGFAAELRYRARGLARSVTVGDFNGDGHADLATANQSNTNDVSVLTGNGDGSFNPPSDFAAGLWPTMIVSGDFNGDGHADLATANVESQDISILIGNGDATFLAPVSLPAGQFSSTTKVLAVGEFDGNGGSDIAAGIYNTHQVKVYLTVPAVQQ